MAVPKSLKEIPDFEAKRIIAKGGYWEDYPEISDFIYKKGGKDWLLRKIPFSSNWETGMVSY